MWQALDGGRARPVRVLAALRRVTALRNGPTAAAVIRAAGPTRWTAALLEAARSLCGGLRSPFGDVVFAPGVRDFTGLGSPLATRDAQQFVAVPQWGVASVRAAWSAGDSQVTILVTSPHIDPATLAAALVVPSSAGPLAATVRDGGVAIEVSGAAIADGNVTVVIPNPLASGAATVGVAVQASPPPA